MYTFFNKATRILQGVKYPAEWNYVKDGLRKNIATVVNYYRNTSIAVPSDHFLVKLLQSIAVSQTLPLERYYENVDALAMNLSMALKMTSSIYGGKIFDGVFYGPGSDEVLIANDDLFDPKEIDRDWKNAAPVKVLMHPKTDLYMNVPNGKNTSNQTGLSVFSINIPMLAVMYRAFRNSEIAFTQGQEESQRSLMQFVHMYVLPNIIFSQTDVAIFNRIHHLQRGIPFGVARKNHPFYLTDYDSRVTRVQIEVLGLLTKGQYNFGTMLRMIPAVVKDNMEQVMLLPSMAPTRQVMWALTCARLPVLDFLFFQNARGFAYPNRAEINTVLRDILYYTRDNVLRQYLPVDIYYDVIDTVEELRRNASLF